MQSLQTVYDSFEHDGKEKTSSWNWNQAIPDKETYYIRKRFTGFQSRVAYACSTQRGFGAADPPIPHPLFAHVK